MRADFGTFYVFFFFCKIYVVSSDVLLDLKLQKRTKFEMFVVEWRARVHFVCKMLKKESYCVICVHKNACTQLGNRFLMTPEGERKRENDSNAQKFGRLDDRIYIYGMMQ